MLSLVRRRLAAQDGFTLIELLAAMAIGSVVLAAAMTVSVRVLDSSAAVQDRVEATQRARLGVDRLIRVLDSQLCVSSSVPPVLPGSSDTVLTIFADLDSDFNSDPIAYRFSYDSAARTVTELRWNGTNTAELPTYSAVLLRNVVPDPGQPVFAYYAYSSTTPPLPTLEVTTIDATTVNRIVRIAVRLRVVPERAASRQAAGTTILGEGFAATADPRDPLGGPRCSGGD